MRFTLFHGTYTGHVLWASVLAAVILFGFLLRLEAVRYSEIHNSMRQDAAQYTAYAYNMDRHGIFSSDTTTVFSDKHKPKPDALRTPGYPWLLSVLVSDDLKVFINRTVYLQAIVSTISLLLLALLTGMTLGKWSALPVVAAAAMSPHLIVANTYILSETLFTFLLILMLITLGKARYIGSATLWILSGITLAYASLTRPSIQYLIIPLAIMLWMARYMRPDRRLIVFFIAAFLTLHSAWTWRNVQTTGRTSNPTLMINALHHGMYPGFMYNNRPESYRYPYRHDPESAEISVSVSRILSEIVKRYSEKPVEYTIWFLSKPGFFFQWEMVQGNDIFIYPTLASPYYMDDGSHVFTRILMERLHVPLVALSILGMLMGFLPSYITRLSSQQRSIAMIVSMTYLYFILLHMIVAPFPRYSIPLRPLTYLLALLPVYSIIQHAVSWYRLHERQH